MHEFEQELVLEEHVAHSFLAMDGHNQVTSHSVVYDFLMFVDTVLARISHFEAEASVALTTRNYESLATDIKALRRWWLN